MSKRETGRQRRRDEIIDTAEEVITKVGRLGWGAMSLPMRLLPKRSRTHLHNAFRELNHGFAGMPRDFAKMVSDGIDGWESAGEPAPTRARLIVEIADAPALLVAPSLLLGAPAEPAIAPPVIAPPVIPAEPAAAPPPTPVAAAVMTMTGVAITYIEHDPPGRDVDGEYVLLRNPTDAPAKLAGWTISDGDSRHIYQFPAFTLAPGAEVRVWTKRGKNNPEHLYWNNRTAIWNNDGDTGTLKDAGGATISVYTYTGKGAEGKS